MEPPAGDAHRSDLEWKTEEKRVGALEFYSILVALITVLIVVGIAAAGAWAQSMWAHLLPRLG